MSRHGHKYSKYKKGYSMKMFYVLSNAKVTFEAQFMKQHWGWKKEKSFAYIKKACTHKEPALAGFRSVTLHLRE